MSGATEADALEIVLAGGLILRGRGTDVPGDQLGGRRAKVAFARLALDPAATVTRDALAEAIWGDPLPQSWRPALRNVIAAIRRALTVHGLDDLAALDSPDGGYRLSLSDRATVDVLTLEADAARAEAATRAGDMPLALTTASADATAAPILPRAQGEWVEGVRMRVADIRLRLERVLGDAALATGDTARAERAARTLIAAEPLREDAHRLLMRSLLAAGNRGAALAAYDVCRRVLADELGARPCAETEAVFRQALTEHPPERAEASTSSGTLLLLQQRTPFVGRNALLERLDGRLRQARNAGPLFVSLCGEAGLGKTRLAAALAARAAAAGAVVLYGRADDRISVPYAALVEALDGPVAALAPPELTTLRETHGGVLGRILPSLASSDEPPEPTGLVELDRLHAEQAILRALELLARPRGALLVLDDMQWATRGTIGVLETVVGLSARAGVLVLALHRSVDDAVMLSDLGSHSRIERLALDPLSAADVAQLASISGVESPSSDERAELARRVWRSSGGNPLLASELLRAWRPGRDEIPSRITELVRARLATMPATVEEVLQVAAVAGLEFEPRTIAQASGSALPLALGALDAATKAGLLTTATRHPDWLAFRHGLVRTSMLDAMSPRTRQRLHKQLGITLEAHDESGGDALVSMAYHFGAAAPLGDWQRAVRYALPVARTAYEAGIYEDVLATSTRALAALREADDPDPLARIDLEVLLGGAQRALGDPDGFETLLAAFAAAREQGDAERMADAALAVSHGGALSDEVFVADTVLERYEEALAALGERDVARRARLLGHIAAAHAWRRSSATSRRAGRAAVTLARDLEDPALLATVLATARRALTGAGETEEQHQLEDELFRFAERLDDPGLRTCTAQWRFDTSIEQGRGEDLERLLQLGAENARTLRMGNYHYSIAYACAALALLRGRVGEADALVEHARAVGLERGVDRTIVDAIRLFQLIGVRHEQQRLDEIRDEAVAFIEAMGVPEWFGGLAFIDAELGRGSEAVGANVDKLSQAFVINGPTFVGPVGYLAHMAVPISRLGDVDRAAAVYEQIRPFAGLGAYFAYFAGPIDYHLGLLARTLGRDGDAGVHLTAATAFCERLGAPRWLERCRTALRGSGARVALELQQG